MADSAPALPAETTPAWPAMIPHFTVQADDLQRFSSHAPTPPKTLDEAWEKADIDKVMGYWGLLLEREGSRGSSLHQRAMQAVVLIGWTAWPALPEILRGHGREVLQALGDKNNRYLAIDDLPALAEWQNRLEGRLWVAGSHAEKHALRVLSWAIRVWLLDKPETTMRDIAEYAARLHGEDRTGLQERRLIESLGHLRSLLHGAFPEPPWLVKDEMMLSFSVRGIR